MKITVAVPTIAGRSHYLRWAVQTCVTQDCDYEILISDNSTGDAREVADSFRDPRIRYIRPPAYLPMSAHWDFVLTQVTGDILTIIGDDDGLMPECIRRVTEIYRSYPNDLPIQHSLGNYRWPDFPEEATRNTFSFLHAPGSAINASKSSAFLHAVARGHARYVDGPMVYHNFVPVALLRRMTRDGILFRRASPDVYSSIAVAANTSDYISTQEVLTIFGQGARANGAEVRNGGADQFMSEMQALYTPRYDSRTVQLQLLDCFVEVAHHFSRPELLADVDEAEHLAQAISEARGMQPPTRDQEVRKVMAIARRDGLRAALALTIARRKIEYLAGRTPLHQGSVIKFDPNQVRNIFDATLAIDQRLGTHNFQPRSGIRM